MSMGLDFLKIISAVKLSFSIQGEVKTALLFVYIFNPPLASRFINDTFTDMTNATVVSTCLDALCSSFLLS